MIKKNYNSSGNLTETTYYLSDEFVRVVNTSGTYDFVYVMHEGQIIAQKLPGNRTQFMLTDHKGSAVAVTNVSGECC